MSKNRRSQGGDFLTHTVHPQLGEKMVNFGPQTKKLHAHMLTHPTGLFRETILSAHIGSAGPWIFLHALDTGQGLLAHTTNLVGGPQKILRANKISSKNAQSCNVAASVSL